MRNTGLQRRRLWKAAAASGLAVLLILSCGFAAAAAGDQSSPYDGFTYNAWDEAVPSQIGYEPEGTLLGTELGGDIGHFKAPRDLVAGPDGHLYVLDSGNNRIVILNDDLTLHRVVDTFTDNGENVTLNQPTGLFVDKDGLLYIADPGNRRVVIAGADGAVTRMLYKPDTNMLEEKQEFQPQKVLVDDTGLIYVVATGIYQGAMIFDSEGNFESFYGSNPVAVTAQLLWDYFWKRLLSAEAAGSLSRYVSEEFTNFTMDSRGFIYTVTQSGKAGEKIRKLNPKGGNILDVSDFGERENIYINGELVSSRFIDIAVDAGGFISALDHNNRRIFQYDSEGELLFIFGGSGIQEGTFLNPSAIAALGDRIVVLDQQKNNLTVFRPTEFGRKVREAVGLYNDGQYGEARALWEDVLRYDHNYSLAYVSIGKALLADNRPREAAEYFRRGNDPEGNSDAFAVYRNETMQRFFPVICCGIVILIVLLVLWYNRKGIKKEKPQKRRIGPGRFLMHPVDSAEEMKIKKTGSMPIACLIMLLWFAAVVLEYSVTGFRFNVQNPDAMNIGMLFLRTAPLFAVWVFANWGVTTLMDGKGRMKEIWITNSYSLVPYVASIYINIMLSWVLVDSEAIFMQWVGMAGLLWSAAILLGTLSGIHEYSLGRTIWSVVLSVCGVLLIIFLVLLVVSMLQQAYGFVYSIVNELMYRLR